MCSSPIGSGGGASINDFSALLGDIGSTQGIGNTDVGGVGSQKSPPVETKDTVEFRDQIQAAQINVYDTPANQPLLTPTVAMPQASVQGPSNIDDLQQTQFVQLVDQLPPSLRVQLLKDMTQPVDQRDPQLSGLESTLQKSAAVTVWEQQVLQGNVQMDQVPLQLRADVAQSIQQGGDPASQVQALLSKPTLTPQDAQKLKALAQLPGAVTPEQLGTINAKLMQDGFNPVTPQPTPPVDGTPRTGQLNPVNGIMPSTIDSTTMPTADITQQMGINGVQVLNNQLAVATAQVKAMPPGPAQQSLMDYLKYVTETISKVQQLLGEIGSADALRGSKQIMGQKAVMEAKMEKAMEQLKAQREEQAKAKMISTIMKVVGVVIAVVCLVLAIFTGGATAIALAAIMLAITVLASTTHVVDDIMKTIMNVIMDVMKAMGLPDDVCKVLMMIIIIIIAIALAVITKGAVMSEGATMAAETAQVASTAARAGEAAGTATKVSSLTKTVATMEAGQAAGLVLTHSNNAIAQGMKPILKAMGMDEKTAELIAMLIQMLVELAVGLVAAGGMAGMAQVSEEMAAVGQQSAANAIKTIEKIQTAVQIITDSIAAITQLQMAELSLEKGRAKAEGVELATLLDMYKKDREFRDKSSKSISELITAYNQFFENVLNSMDKILSQTFA